MSNNLVAWAVPALSKLFPLDDESLTQIVTYSAGLSKPASAEHLKNLLGDSPAVLEFISSFNARRPGDPSSTPQSGSASPRTTTTDAENRNQPKKNKRTKAPLHSTGPPRRPENYGNVTGGYRKTDAEDDYMTTASSRSNRDGLGTTGSSASLTDVPSLSTKPAAVLRPRTTDSPSSYGSSPATSRNQSPAPRANTKPPPSASGPLISDYLPNVKSKPAKSSRPAASGSLSPAKGSVTTTNIADLTAAIAALEVSTNPTSAKNRQTCNCNASIHPLFAPAPNCLSCGKVICSLEGLQPCSFCGAALLSNEEIQSMIKELRAERGQEKMRAHNDSVHHTGGPGMSPASSPSKLDAAMAHRDKLLAFQAQNVQRTRVLDEAADFETPNVASTQWMSPSQRALALKKQQRILRQMEEKARPEWERKKTVMSLDIKGGRVVRTYQAAPSASTADPTGDDESDIEAVGENNSGSGGAAFSKNPLLASGGLVRPVWKSSINNGKASEKAPRREPRQTWRRVQDDNDDNEQWILDGGIHGHSNDSGA